MKLYDVLDKVSLANVSLENAITVMDDLVTDMCLLSGCDVQMPGYFKVRIRIIKDYLDDLNDLLPGVEKNLLDLVQGDDDDAEDINAEALGGTERRTSR